MPFTQKLSTSAASIPALASFSRRDTLPERKNSTASTAQNTPQ